MSHISSSDYCEEKIAELRSIVEEYDTICRELLDNISWLQFAFDANDHRCVIIRKLCAAYNARRCAAYCGTPDAHITDKFNSYRLGEDGDK